MKYFILDNEKIVINILDFLSDTLGIPNIQMRLNIYPENEEGGIQIEALNNNIYFRDVFQTKFVYVKNKNLKQFFELIHKHYNCKYFINDIVLIKFSCANILFETIHGNILSVDDEDLANTIVSKFGLKKYNHINEHTPTQLIELENLFDPMGNLNNKIKSYSLKTGLDIRSVSASMRVRLSNLSNDYSHIEKYFKMITKTELLGFNSQEIPRFKFKNMSIIIPVYNQNVTYTLLAIQGQDLSKEDKQKIQVVIVDDGSKNNVVKEVESIKDILDYEVSIISFCKNMGLSAARNAGLALAKHDLFLFMDSDIILSKDYLRDINVRLQIVPNAIFVAMRKNISNTSDILESSNLLRGISPCLDLDDSRVITKSKEYHIGWDKAYIGEQISILDDSDYFKQLGFGSKIGIYDLSTVVTGHNMAVNRAAIPKFPAFSTEFKGWGMEDACFASTLIANGCFVIPLLSSNVYHIDHPPRSGSVEQKSKEAAQNHKIYNEMLDREWNTK